MKFVNSFLLLFAFVFASAQNVVKIKDIEVGPGESAKLHVLLSNSEAVSGFQFKISTPQGLIVSEREVKLSGRQTDHVVYPKKISANEYLFVCFSAKGENLKGSEGDLLEIPIEVPINFVPRTVLQARFTESILSSSAGERIAATPQDGVIRISQGKTVDILPENVSVSLSTINPNEPVTVKWNVKNIGQLEGVSGWQEEISLVSDTNTRYIIGRANYSGALAAGTSISREQTVNVPKVIGVDGNVRIEIKLIPNSDLKEPESLRLNNTAFSTKLQLSKKLFLELDKTGISENSEDKIRIGVSRSGSYSNEETVTVSSEDGAFVSPVSAKFEANQSSAFVYVSPVDNKTYEGDRDIRLKASSSGYPDAYASVKVLDDERLVLSISYSANSTKAGGQINFELAANSPRKEDTTVWISTDLKNRIKLPASVVLPAGKTSVSFVGEIPDTGLVEKSQEATVFVKTDGYSTGITKIKLSASGVPDFKLSVAQKQISEGDGIKATTARITRTTNLDKVVTVAITHEPDGNLILPSEIIFEKGVAEKTFALGTVDNSTVEGQRNVTVWAKVKFPSCNCIDHTEAEANTSVTVEILDNDGLSLSVLPQPSTLKAGTSGKLKISRNTTEPGTLSNSVTVTLSADNQAAVQLPETVVMPAGAAEIVVDFTTRIDANAEGDKTVRVTASSSGYSSGFGWILLTDQNKADISIENITTSQSINAAEKLSVNVTFKNIGNADFPAGGKVDYYFTPTSDISKATPFRTTYISRPIAKDENFVLPDEVQLPAIAGDQYLTVVINRSQIINELSWTNNEKSILLQIKPSYKVNIAVDKKTYRQGETVKITGTARTDAGAGVAASAVEITVKNGLFTRTFNVTTNSDGMFVYDFVPVQNESGTYSVSAAYPGAASESSVAFEILGLEIINKPQYMKWETLVNIPLGKEFTLKNTTSARLTDVKIEIPDTYNLEIDQSAITIEPNSTATLSYKLISKEASKELKYEEIPLKITSAEGAAITETVYYHSRMPQPALVAVPATINTTMIKGQKRLYEFSVKNTGATDAQDVEVKLPALQWMRLASSQRISLIKAGEEAKVALEFEPTVKEQINVPVIGNLALVPKNGGSLSVPFSIETVSTDSGKLIVDAVDEYYYNTAQAPHLRGAKVTVKHPYTGAVIKEGITNENGIFEIADIKEGWYTVSVTADKHDPYQNNILVDPGKTTAITAFLPYKAVTYTWDVKPTEIQDQYDVKLNVDFETNVPKPVIVMKIDNNKLDLKPGESRMTYITVTNYGLIAANNVKISISDVPGYTIKPIINSLNVINAQSTIVIPVLLTNTGGGSSLSGRMTTMAASSGSNCHSGTVLLEATYPCGGVDEKLFSYEVYVSLGCGSGGGGGIGGGGGAGGPYGGGGPGGDVGASSVSVVSLDICDTCTKAVVGTFLKCFPLTAAGDTAIHGTLCVIDIISIKKWWDILYAVENCQKAATRAVRKVECPKDIACAIYQCVTGWKNKTPKLGKLPNFNICDYINKKIRDRNTPSARSANTQATQAYSTASTTPPSYVVNMQDYLIAAPALEWDGLYNDFIMFTFAQEAKFDKINAYLNNWNITDNGEKLYVVMKELAPYIDGNLPLTAEKIAEINSKFKANGISENFLPAFSSRWNRTLEAWSKGVNAPNAEFPGIIDKAELDYYDSIAVQFDQYLTKRGFVSAQEMYITNMQILQKFVEEKQAEPSSTCATVSLEFPQKLTMTREAFEGTLKINNGSSKVIKDITLDLIVTDAYGENKTALFQINKDTFINGTGAVQAGASGSGKALFIPSKEAAPVVPVSYNFGGILSYFDAELNDRVYVTLKPVTLQVNPSPDLELHYFMQRNILGDDALTTDKVEPVIPAELSLLIKNEGYGEAKNVQVESMQPKIIDNEKGLAIDFSMIGSNFNNQPTELGLLNVNFGTIAPKSAAVGQWWFTSSLMGHFIRYDVQANHASSFGNSRLSLIKASYVHELIKSIKDYRGGSDQVSDFLVNDVADAQDIPDKIYLSNGNSEDVYKAENVTVSGKASAAVQAVKLTISPQSSGWNYGFVEDPGANIYKLERVVRDKDQKDMPLQNFWRTYVTLKDGLNPKYENKLHALDVISEPTTYTLYYKPVDGSIPEVLRFENVPLENSPNAVETVKVKFNKEIDVNTFTNKNVELVFQGTKLPSENILIGKIDATTYSISIKGLTQASGYYQLTVNALGIKDLLGNEGRDGKKISWIQFINELGILEFKTDQVKKQPLNTVKVVFNKKIRSGEFTADKVSINGQPAPNIKISKIDDYTYEISGLQDYNKSDAEYTIKINTPKITSEDGVKGIAEQSYRWIVNTTAPEVSKITPWYQGAMHAQHVTDFEIKLNEKLESGLEASSLALYKDGQKTAVVFDIKNVDDTTYIISNFAEATSQNGSYKLVINQSELKDGDGNIGAGQKEYAWQVNHQNIGAIKNLRLTPDKGVSNTDNVTSGDVSLAFETLQDNLKIEVFELQATQPVLVGRIDAGKAGTYSLPVNSVSGAKKFKVVAHDTSGNTSEPVYLNGYIDGTDFSVSIVPIKAQTDVCSGFNYLEVKFSEPIESLPLEALSVLSSGVIVPQNKMTIKKIDDQNYVIENIYTDRSEDAVLSINRKMIAKQLTGLKGSASSEAVIGIAAVGGVSVMGTEKPVLGALTPYTATANMLQYDWIAINGEIQQTTGNVVNVKWQKPGLQSLVLKYVNQAGCTSTVVKNVEVLADGSLSTVEQNPKNLAIAPVPNDGNFTIFTNKVIRNANIMIYDMSGRLVQEQRRITIDHKYPLTMQRKVGGMYIIIIQNDEDRYQFRFIVK